MTHAGMRVVGVTAVGDCLARMGLSCNEEGFEVGDCATASQMPQMISEAEHGRQPGDHLLLHLCRRGATVQGVIVRVDQHGRQVADDRDRVRRLQHLADIAGVEEGIVVAQSVP
jgi:hypothetical protein